MAKKQDNDLLQTLRAAGMRKKVAHAVSQSAGKAGGSKPPKAITRTVGRLRTAASELEDRVTRSRRSQAAKEAAQTRKRKAAKRSAAARKAAKTRAKAG